MGCTEDGCSGQRRVPPVLCCKDGDETRGLNLEEQREKRTCTASLPGFLVGRACGLEGGAGCLGCSG